MDIEARIVAQVLMQADVIATAVVKKVTPCKDDLSTRQAYALFGREWIIAMLAEGRLKSCRQGGKVIISRHECEVLRAVQWERANDALSIITSKPKNKHENI